MTGEVGKDKMSICETKRKISPTGGQGFTSCNCQKSVNQKSVCANQIIFCVIQNAMVVHDAIFWSCFLKF